MVEEEFVQLGSATALDCPLAEPPGTGIPLTPLKRGNRRRSRKRGTGKDQEKPEPKKIKLQSLGSKSPLPRGI
jgi:hypothetical protein